MRWPDATRPVRMQRVALVAPSERWRRVLVAVAESGAVQFEHGSDHGGGKAAETLERVRRARGNGASGAVTIARETPDLDWLERTGMVAELAGEVELERIRRDAQHQGSVAAWVGWSPEPAVQALAERVGDEGGAVVRLGSPRDLEPPTLIDARGAAKAFQPLVDAYAPVAYHDVDPAAVAGVAYVVMFGMMFGDVGHGSILVLAGLVLRVGRAGFLRRLRHLAPFVIGAGLMAIGFGVAYGECFGPTGLVPTLWLDPVDHATTLLAAAVAVGGVLLALSYVIGTVNRWREGGMARALVAFSGLAGAALFLGLGLAGFGWYRHSLWPALAGGTLAATGAALGALGCYVESARRAEGFLETAIELFDAVLRIGTNTVSFARLAAFGLTHAALCALVWSATSGWWHRGGLWWILAAVLFVVGNALAFVLEGLVAAIQALRLEYYELFSRIFQSPGQPFEPWRPTVSSSPLQKKEPTCSPG